MKLLAALVATLMLFTAPAMATARLPLVLNNGQTQQLQAGDTLQLKAPTTASATINMPQGTAPTAPNNGDCWTTSTGLFCQINGATVGPYSSSQTTNYALAACNNAAGDGAILQTAVNTGRTVYISGPCHIDSTVTFNTSGQKIYGSSAAATQLVIPSSAVGSFATGVFVVNITGGGGAQNGPTFQDFSINLQQPDPVCTSVNGYITGTTLTVNSVTGGSLSVGNYFTVATYNLAPNTKITALGSGSGGAGTYTVSVSQTSGSSGSPLTFIVDGSCSRSAMVNYPPAIYAQNQVDVRAFRIKITGAMIGIDARGGSQFVLDDIQTAAFSVALWFDGGGDTNRINNWHSWPFGIQTGTSGPLTFTPAQQALYSQSNTSCTPQTNSGNNGAISLMSGGGFLQITNALTITGQGWCAFSSTSGATNGFGPQLLAANIDFDTFSGLNVSGGTVSVTDAAFTGAIDKMQAITQSGGALTIGNSWIGNAVGPGTSPVPLVYFRGGLENAVGGPTASLTLNDTRIETYSGAVQDILSDQSTGFGTLTLDSNTFWSCVSCTYSNPIVGVTGGVGTRVKINNNYFAGSATVTAAVSIATDDWNTVTNNTAPGMTFTFPGSPTEGIYTCNNSSGTGIACGNGSGSGTITGVTAGTNLSGGGTSGTVTLNLNAALTGITSISDSASHAMIQYSGGSNAVFLGNTTSSGISANGQLLPDGDNIYPLGASSFRWSNLFSNVGTFSTSATIGGNAITSLSGSATTGHCVQFASTSGLVSDSGSACGGGGGGVTSLSSGNSNIVVSPSTGAVTATMAATLAGITNITDSGGHSAIQYPGGASAVFLGNTTASAITSNGQFLPGTDNAYTLGAGSFRWTTVYATTGTINTSDERLKKDVQDERLGLLFIRKLHPVSYVFKSGEPGTMHGLLAQEVDTALAGEPFAGLVKPTDGECTTSDSSGCEGLRYSEFIAPLIKSVQELDLKITFLYGIVGILFVWNIALTVNNWRYRRFK